MKSWGAFVFTSAGILFLAMIWNYRGALPDEVVSQFNGAGTPSGRMSSASFLGGMIGVGLLLPALLSALMFSFRFLSPKFLNTPYPEYWRKPENYRHACEVMFRSSLWFSAAYVLWASGLLHLIASANEARPPRLQVSVLWLLVGFLIAASAVWTLFLTRFFLKEPPRGEES